MLGVEAMLQDMGEFVEEKVVGSDSISALSLSAGTGSLEDKTFANQGWMVAGGYKQWDNKANACTGSTTTCRFAY